MPTKPKGGASPKTQKAAKPVATLPAAPAPGRVRRYTMGTLVRRRIPITDLLMGPRWLGDVTPWSDAPPAPGDVPSWINGTRRARRLRVRSTMLLTAASSSLLAASAYLFVAGR